MTAEGRNATCQPGQSGQLRVTIAHEADIVLASLLAVNSEALRMLPVMSARLLGLGAGLMAARLLASDVWQARFANTPTH